MDPVTLTLLFLTAFLLSVILSKIAKLPIIAATKDLKLFEKLANINIEGSFIKNSQTAKLIFTQITSRLGLSSQEISDKLGDWSWEEMKVRAAT